MHLIIDNTHNPIQIYENRVRELREKLNERASADHAEICLKRLFLAFSSHEFQKMTAEKIAIYMLACEDLPPWALSQTVIDFIKYRVSGQSKKYLPKPPEIAAHAKSIVEGTVLNDLQAAYERLKVEKERAVRREEDAKIPKTPEEWAQRKAQVDALMKQLGRNGVNGERNCHLERHATGGDTP